jgi:hypothetical protein
MLGTRPSLAAAQDTLPNRPQLPDEETYPTPHFLIHFTRTGEHAVDPTDTSGDGVPDYVVRTAETLEINWQTQVVDFGWAPPPPDSGRGGSDLLDVYLENLMADEIAGYTDTAGGYIGDNPLTTEVEHYASASYMSIDNDFIEVADQVEATGETPFDLMRVTVAHEFNHTIQAGYDDFDPHFWLYEATAIWMQDQVFDDTDDGIFYLDALFSSTDTCLVAQSGRLGHYDHWYAEWLFLRHLSETHGAEVVRTIWEQSRELDGFEAIDAALAPLGSSLEEATRNFAIANLLRDYEDGSLYPVVRLEGETGTGTFTPIDGIQSLGVDYVRLTGEGVVTIQLTQSDVPMSLLVVGLAGDQAEEIRGEGGTVTVDLNRYDDTFIIIHNDERVIEERFCQYSGYALEIHTSSPPTSPVAANWSAVNYQMPSTEFIPIFDNGDYQPPGDLPFAEGEHVEVPTDLEITFEPLIPASLPEGYVFVYGYIMQAEDFGPDGDFYVPGGGDSANYDYQGDSGNWMSVAESPSPYTTLDEWLVDIDYDPPGDRFTIDGVEVLSEDLSEGDSVWISITLIYDGLFIVVDASREDGNVVAAEDDALALVKGLLQAGDAVPVTANGAAEPAQEPSLLPEALVENHRAIIGWIGLGLIILGFGGCFIAGLITLRGIFLWLQGQRHKHTGQTPY